MSNWPACKARRVLAALLRVGWSVKRQSGSHRLLTRPGWPDYEFAFHGQDEIGGRMLARVAKHTGLKPEDLDLGLSRGARGQAARPAISSRLHDEPAYRILVLES